MDFGLNDWFTKAQMSVPLKKNAASLAIITVDKLNVNDQQPADHSLALLNKEIHLHSSLHKCHLLPTGNMY